jgi:protein-L-isoaspartate(D-aspartate) O-methyltransferase
MKRALFYGPCSAVVFVTFATYKCLRVPTVDFIDLDRLFTADPMSDFATARLNMVESQIRTNGVHDPAILAALGELPRERFVPEAFRGNAYLDEDLRIREGRYLMEPLVLARLLQMAELGAEDVVLDIGCGPGYSTAVLARLSNTVVALEEDPELAAMAVSNLAALDIDNIAVVEGKMAKGYPEQAPYDVIFLGGAVSRIPEALLDQLADGGRLVAVVTDGDGVGKATRVVRSGAFFSRQILFDACVPPLPGFESAAEFVF